MEKTMLQLEKRYEKLEEKKKILVMLNKMISAYAKSIIYSESNKLSVFSM